MPEQQIMERRLRLWRFGDPGGLERFLEKTILEKV